MIKRLGVLGLTVALASCFGGGESDKLRNGVSQEGISLGLQADLPSDSLNINVVASIYEDGARQPLVGGDFFIASSHIDDDRLTSLENLSGDYKGTVEIASVDDIVTVETVYDPERAREDRWYPSDELYYDPGPNEALVGYGDDFEFPDRLTNVAISSASFSSRSDDVSVTWDAGTADQASLSAVVTCVDGDDEISYPFFTAIGNDDGSHTFDVGDVIPNELIVNAVGTIEAEIATILAALYLNLLIPGLVDASDIPLDTFDMDYCDVNLTLFREEGLTLPDGVEGGFVISSSSQQIGDDYSFRYTPGGS
ncbi:MAG: hypothetical protein MI867_04995 [Pseudomonadales bacterium]|nr:hypothetical protein [Pseudomonadales bacterium]